MRQLFTRTLVLVAAIAAASSASAEKLLFYGVHKVQFSNIGQAVVSGSGTGLATVNGSAGLGHLNTLQLTTNFASIEGVIDITDPVVTAGGIVEIRLTSVKLDPAAGGGVFAPISGALQNTSVALTQNTVPEAGFVRICLFVKGCGGAVLTQDLSQTVNGVRTGVGVGGVVTIGAFGPIRISILGAPWTVKTVSVSNRTSNEGITNYTKRGFAHGPASLTSSTAVTSGVIQLVSPSQQIVQGVPGNSDKSGNINILNLHFIPEPGLLLLLGTGAAGLVVLGRRRMKR
jgi:hypothetical protein